MHQACVAPYGQSYGPGDVIGCLIDFETQPEELAKAEVADAGVSAGPADATRQSKAQELHAQGAPRSSIESVLLSPQPLSAPAGGDSAGAPSAGAPTVNTRYTVNQRFWGSSIRFYRNGVDQGIAFVHCTRERRYYPAASMYKGGIVQLVPGPVFRHPPPAEQGWRPMCEAEQIQQAEEASHAIAHAGANVKQLSFADLQRLKQNVYTTAAPAALRGGQGAGTAGGSSSSSGGIGAGGKTR